MENKLKNVIWKTIDRITFIRFEHLSADAVIAIKKFKNTLIITPRHAKADEQEFQLTDYQSSDPELIALVDECCEREYTAFVCVQGSYYELSAIPATKEDVE